MPNRRFNTQVANPMKAGGRVKKAMGGMSQRKKRYDVWLLQRRYGYEGWCYV